MSKSGGWILGSGRSADSRDFSDDIALNDHKIKFAVKYCRGKDVLDLGCVQHNPENYRSRYWMHGALASVARSIEGLDIYAEGVEYLRERGFRVSVGDAQDFDIDRNFDVIMAGDLIEHLEDLGGFLNSCRKHLRSEGVLIISTPNPWYWRHVVKAFLFSRVNANPEHTLWMCPVTLRQLLARHEMEVSDVAFGSRYLRDRLVPLPKGIKHTSFHVAVRVRGAVTN